MQQSDQRFDAHQALAQWLALAGDVPSEMSPLPATAHSMLGEVCGSHGQLIAAAIGEISGAVGGDPRWPMILRERLITRRTLDSIGTELGLTRERVRQLESTLRAKLDDCAFVGLVIDGVRRRLHPFAHVTEILAAVPALADPIPGLTVNCLDVVEALAPDWSMVGCGWLVAEGTAERIDDILAERADAVGTVEVRAAAEELGVGEAELADYLATVGRRFLFRGRVINRDRSIGDRALAILTLADGAMTTAQLAELIPGRTRPSIRNALSAEPAIIRCAPDTWTTAGREGAVPVNHARPELTGSMYLHGGRWSVLVDADAVMATDESVAIPHAIPALAGAAFDAPVRLSGDGCSASVRWRRQGAVGTSIGATLAERDYPGDRVRVIVEGGFEVVPVPETTASGPWAVAYSTMGLGDPPEDPHEALRIVAVAIGLPADAPYCTIAARLRLRDQAFVADSLADAVAQGYTLEP
ncbi:sigma factor-like helix-turn-helix DNA-binding protein [Corynebacterium sp. NPDC060344]|uniref:sigma factor-like helix-turn-helix DNA-binding protein n=1 Tax=Corynebacterium sp. NPDC060344 TaxID=3347101 RepID=UPI00364B99EC